MGTILVNTDDVYNSKIEMSDKKTLKIWEEYESKIKGIKYTGDAIMLSDIKPYCLDKGTQ